MMNMRKWLRLHHQFSIYSVTVRSMTTTEVSAALRPFYFSVHPDLFGQHPSQRSVNENSLKQLSSFIECVQSRKSANPCNLQFYIRKKNDQNSFRLVKIYLKERDIRKTILTILKSCDLSTDYIDKIPKEPSPPPQLYKQTFKTSNMDSKDMEFDENDPIFGAFILKKRIRETMESFQLKSWLSRNHKAALELTESHKPLHEDVLRLQQETITQLQLLDLRWECGWNHKHFKGCLQSLQVMAEQHPESMHVLKDRILVFAPFTGLSLDGHVMLNSGEVRHNWLDLLKNVKKYDKVFLRIPSFERAVSQVLLGIKVVRRKFMPKILAGEYERHLQQITTNINDFLSRHSFPRHWPPSLKDYELVVETEAGPLMVSPTGQFITPATCPGSLLITFISDNMVEASQRMADYTRDKHIEQSLYEQCINDLQLASLYKDDNIAPDAMIQCCQKLLDHKNDLRSFKELHLFITTYYSVLADGTVCIPWNWNI